MRSIIKVIGVGGGGSNAVNFMYEQGIRDVEFVVVNTDVQALKASPVPTKLQIGTNLTEGLGAGANPEKGRMAAEESIEEVRTLLGDNTKMVFITAGMGGGTGTGAAPVIASIAREMGILTVGIVTSPFRFEGLGKRKQAELGIAEMKRHCDTVLEILNDKLLEMFGPLPVSVAFAQADNILATAARSIAEIITRSGQVNVDFEDVKTVLSNAGTAVIGSARCEGNNRAIRATEEALAAPLLNNRDIAGASRMLLSIVTSKEHEMNVVEMGDITTYIEEKAGGITDMIFGHSYDDNLGEALMVTVIAAGFEGSKMPGMGFGSEFSQDRKVIELDRRDSQREIELTPYVTPTPPRVQQRDAYELTASAEQSYLKPELPLNYTPTPVPPQLAPAPQPAPEYYHPQIQAPQPLPAPLQHGNAPVPAPIPSFMRPAAVQQSAPAPARTEGPQDMDRELMIKRQRMLEQAQARKTKLKGLGNRPVADYTNLEKPTYERQNLVLTEPQQYSNNGTFMSRYSLNEEQELTSNKFLHDNVD